MRTPSLAAAVLAVGAAAVSLSPAQAGDTRFHSRLYHEDPYAYRFELPRYYPYYNSGYWVPRAAMRYRYRNDTVLPPYQPSWGYPAPVLVYEKGAAFEPRAHHGHRTYRTHRHHATPR